MFSTPDQDPTAQLEQLRTYCGARGWGIHEYVDHGVSGAKERRPGLDALLQAVRRRTVDVVVCTKLDRLARSLEHLIALGKEFKTLGVDVALSATEVLLDLIESELASKEPANRSAAQP